MVTLGCIYTDIMRLFQLSCCILSDYLSTHWTGECLLS